MMASNPIIISRNSVSHAWGELFISLLDLPKRSTPPLLLSIDQDGQSSAKEVPAIRSALEQALFQQDAVSVDSTAFTIFPYKMWVRRGRPDMTSFGSTCTKRVLPRLKKLDRRNVHGTYFSRMMAWEQRDVHSTTEVNQLAHIVHLLTRSSKRPRHSATQIAVLDPLRDHTGQAVRGFPCLQQVAIGLTDDGELDVTAFYPTQYVFERAYGNYLGLCHLGLALAHCAGLKFARLQVFVNRPTLGDSSKASLASLASSIRKEI